ncbi:MAG: MYXO-CTERM sorting domain-containing protein [Sandaracinaceae bacterium]
MDQNNACGVCDPSVCNSEWTAVPSCGGTDAGTPATDAGTTTPPADDGGCSVSPGSRSHAGIAFGLLALGALFVRRRRS